MKASKKWSLKPRQDKDILTQLLTDRGYKDLLSQQNFLKPTWPQELVENQSLTGLKRVDLGETSAVVGQAIKEAREIIIHGDYDVDGLCATAILWKTIYQDLGYKNCRPFIPNRFDHGYGLSKESIDSLSSLRPPLAGSQGVALLITVDCGITAATAVEYAQAKGFEVLVVDHHIPPEKLPDCLILWTDKMCAAALAWVLALKLRVTSSSEYLDLAGLATIADLQPLTGFNRSLTKFGLEELNQTSNLGLQALIKAVGIENRKIGTFEVGWVIAPRLNAAGRLENALESLRLLCTNDSHQAEEIALRLNQVNLERQELTRSMVTMAIQKLGVVSGGSKIKVVAHEEFHEGIIGLVAGKLVQEYGTPVVVISQGLEFSKASARSVSGFNIVEFLRSLGNHFEDIGGHAGAAGFTIRTEKIEAFLSAVKSQLSDVILPEQTLNIDAEVKFEELTLDLLSQLKKLEPFGLGNPEPVFLLKRAKVMEARTVGFANQHLKIRVTSNQSLVTGTIDCIGFDLGDRIKEIEVGEKVDLVFYLSEDQFNGVHKLSLKIKDFLPTHPS